MQYILPPPTLLSETILTSAKKKKIFFYFLLVYNNYNVKRDPKYKIQLERMKVCEISAFDTENSH